MLLSLPVDILPCIFRYCLLADIMRIERTNKYLLEVCRNRYLPTGKLQYLNFITARLSLLLGSIPLLSQTAMRLL